MRRWLMVAALAAAPVSAAAQELGGAESFAVLGGASVTNTGASTIAGDVGVFPGTAITGFPPGTLVAPATLHEADAVAAQAQLDAGAAFDDLAARTCPAANNLSGQNLGNRTLPTGAYCFDGDAPFTGALTLSGAGPWIFQIDGNLITTDGASVVVSAPGGACSGSQVFWTVGGSTATLAPSTRFAGTLLAESNVVVGAGSVVDGRVVALDGSVTMAASTVTACSAGRPFPWGQSLKITGGGQIAVSSDPAARGSNRGTYGFVARPGTGAATASGHLNYLNHSTRLHVNGPVTATGINALLADGSVRSIRFSGTCRVLPACTYSVVAEDNGEPGRRDRFGVVVVSNGAVVEAQPIDTILHGNIQLHEGPVLSTALNDVGYSVGDIMTLTASLDPGPVPVLADAYLVLQLPDGQWMSWTGSGLVPGLVPIVRSFVPVPFNGVVAQIQIPAGAPQGMYTWLSGLTAAGTLNLITPVAETVFTIGR